MSFGFRHRPVRIPTWRCVNCRTLNHVNERRCLGCGTTRKQAA